MVKSSRIAALLAGACAIATSAHAQSAAPSAPAPAPQAGGQVQEVVVTAQRRSERLHDVPLAVSVVSAQQLSNSNYVGLTNLQNLVPSLQYNSYVGGGFQVRGVGTQTVNLSTEQDVAIVIDDVVQGLPELTFATPSYQALTDIDRVEVLKGPQGTLFGKNSSVGVLQIITKKPQLDTFEADGSVSAATRGEYNETANVNVPIGHDAAVRISAFDYHHDGYIKNVYTGKDIGGYDQYGARAKFLWKPTDKLSVYLIGEEIRTFDTGNGAWTIRSCGSGFTATFAPCTVDKPYGIVPGPNNRQVAQDAATPANTDTTSGSLHIDYDLGKAGVLTSITALANMNSFENVDVDMTPLAILDADTTRVGGRQLTQEVRLASPSNQFLEYTVGAFFYKVDSDLHNILAGTFDYEPLGSPYLLSNGFAGLVSGGETVLNSHTQSYAFFGQATLHLTSQFQLLGGIRYSHDDITTDVHAEPVPNICEFGYAFGGPCHSVTLPSPIVSLSTNASNVSGKVTLKYNFTDRINAYASFASGYKGPAISYGTLLPLSAVKPETSTAYEIGLKSELFDRRLVLNADAFYEKYVNFQADTFVQQPNGASNYELGNAGGLESKGIEADATWQATHDLTLNGSVAYVPTQFTDFVIQCQSNATNPATGPCYANNSLFNAKGYPLPQSPDLTYTLAGNYRHDLGDGFVVDANLNWSWRSSTYTEVADRNTIQQGYGLLGGGIGIGAADGRWRLSLFARNLLDQHFQAAIFQSFLDNSGGVAKPTLGYVNVPSIEAQRTVGVKLNVKFGG